ncbi:MAG: LTA synthase family protein [Bacteroidales bacterium]|nr:LTA synthase family protein [Bacteroidales bacterium]
MKQRLLFLVRLYVTLLLVFMTQKVVFMLVNIAHADGAPFGSCLAVLWHGLRLDSVAASYLLIVPVVVLLVSCFVKRMDLRRVLRPYYWIAAVLMGVLFVADVVLYAFWGAKIDANDLMYAAKPKDMLASVTWWSIVLGVLVIALICWHYYRRLRHATPEELGPLCNRWLSLLFVPLFGLVFLGMRGSISQSTANPSYAYFSTHAFCNHAALNPLFNMLHSLFKVEDLDREFDFAPREEVEASIAPLFAYDGAITDTLLNTQRPDVMLIIWEGGGWEMVMNDSVSPNLQQLSREGVFFTHCQANSFRTDRGVVSVLNGWQGLPTTSLMKMTDKCRKLPSLASALAAEGYRTRFVYGGDIDFTNMRCYLSETGFTSVMGSEDFPESRRLSNWGAPDAYTLVPQSFDFASPSFNVVLTLSSHEPWEAPMHRLADPRQNAFAYADSCIGAFVDSLRTLPQWDNLLVIIVPDHGIPSFSGQSTGDPLVAHVPMVWVGGAVRAPRQVDVLMSQNDLAATLLAQMGIDASPFILSRNVLSPSYNSRRHFALHTFKNGCNLIDSTGITRFDCIDRKATAIQGNPASDHETFVKQLLQYIYQRTAAL